MAEVYIGEQLTSFEERDKPEDYRCKAKNSAR